MNPTHSSTVSAADLAVFIDESPTPFCAVAAVEKRLTARGFTALDETEAWSLAPGARRYVVRNDSTIIAFIVGRRGPADAGFKMIGAHTDSPNLRVKPCGDVLASGYREVSVEIYGGVLLSTWLDRDLGIAGRVIVRGTDGCLKKKRVVVRSPVARVPALAIHLDREVNERGLVLNKETHMRPVWGLDRGRGFVEWLAAEAGAAPQDIAGFEMMFFDVVPSTFGGAEKEFLYAARLDNLASCHAALTSLVDGEDEATDATRVIALYDNEEIGSATHQGAGGSFLGDVLTRISAAADPSPEALLRAKARSFLVSADMAHAIHPNYADKHDALHAPRLNQGPVIKINANARYATDGESAAAFAGFARDAGVNVQRFVMRSDMACGSTIGPIVATREGVKTVDVGNPMLSMHSCREMCGSDDQAKMIATMRRFFLG